MKRPLSEEANQKPLSFALIFLLTAVLCIVFPTEWISAGIGRLNAAALIRTLFGAAGIFLMILFGQKQHLGIQRAGLKNADIIAAGVLIAVNNFPLVALFSGEAAVTAGPGDFASFLFFCFSVGLFEEIFFRGLIFAMLLVYFKDKKYGSLWAVFAQAAVFALVHLLNLFGGSSPGAVIMQVGYTFLTGMLYAVIYYMTRSVWFAVLCHALYDVGGFLISEAGSGKIWLQPQIILTAVVAVLVVAWLAFRFIRTVFREEKEKDREKEEIKENQPDGE